MKVYHLRTLYQDTPDARFGTDLRYGEGYSVLDALCIPDRKLLFGFIDLGKHRGRILNLSRDSTRAEAIIHAEVYSPVCALVSQSDLEPLIVARLVGREHKVSSDLNVYTTIKFDNKTDSLVRILSGEGSTTSFLKWLIF